jgi:SOS-response transcriptional repressor LexA
MVPAGISDGDVVIVDLAADWSEGRVVLARVGDDLLVKRVFYGAALNSVVLRADAEGYADISDPDTYVLGVVLRSSKAIH